MPPLDFKIKQPGATLMVALSSAFPLTGMAANAGRIDFASGDVQALAPDGRSRTLIKGATFNSGETIETGNNGRAQLRFTDGAQVSLQPKSQFRIDDYNFSGKPDGSEKGFFSLLKGGLRTITGWVGRTNRDNYKVTTAVATIGIRGTEYSVTYGNSITITTGEGVIEICNTAGCMILNSGETAYVADGNTQPVMSEKKADVPPPPPEEDAQFSVADNTDSSGEPVVIGGGGLMPSGPGYRASSVGGHGSPVNTVESFSYDGTAIFSGNTMVFGDDGEGFTASASGATLGAADGIIGWGRWSSAVMTGAPSPLTEFHYVVGKPTATSEINALNAAVSFSFLGATTPSYTNNSPGSVTGGSLTANFPYEAVSFSLSMSTGTSIVGSGSITGSSFSGDATFNGSTATGSFSGFFAGTNAARAGLTYKIFSDPNSSTGDRYGHVWGAAAFSQ